MKTFKKVLASTLAAAMVVTALPVTPASAASAPKLSATKVTLYASQTKAIKITTPSTWKSVKTTVSSSKKSVATVKKNSTKTFTVKAVKAGTATVTVKVTAKKSGKTVKKTLTSKITVKPVAIKAKAAETTVAVGTTAKDLFTVAPAGKKLAYKSSDDAVATVDANGVVTAVKAGEATITASSKYAEAPATVKVTVKNCVLEAVKQTKANTIETVVTGKTADLKAADFKVANTANNNVVAVKTVTVDKTDATKVTIETFADITDAATYAVTLDGVSKEFTATDGVVADITVAPLQITADTEGTEIKAQTTDKNGVVIKEFKVSEKPSNIDFSLSTTQGYVNGDKLVLPTAGNKGVAEVTYHTYKYDANAVEIGAISKKFEIVAVAATPATIAGYNYTIAKNAPDWTKEVKCVNTFSVSDTDTSVFFNFVDSNKKNVTNQYSVVSSDDSVLLLPKQTLTSNATGVKVVGVKAGNAYINVLKDDKVVTSLPVVVTDGRKLANVTLGASSLTISNSATGFTSATVDVKAVDQYNADVTLESKDVTVTAQGTNETITGSYADGKVTINVNSVKKGSYPVKIEVKKGDVTISRIITVIVVETTKTADNATDLRLVLSTNKIDLAVAADADAAKAAKTVTAQVVAYDQGAKVGVVSGASFTLNDKTDNITTGGAIKAVTVDNNKATKNIKTGTYVVKATVNGKTFAGSFVVEDTQTAASVKVNKKVTTKTEAAEILAETCEVTYDGKKLENPTFTVAADQVKTNGTSTYIGSATVTVTNAKGISYEVSVVINTTFTK